ncbi:9981_t:CDS:2 [Funneliformis geosporum]|uniref:9981_t:CDS:1 n=1 Tax=Funneliformis geosporum TaxID=1117311 RepID=A0A9W4WSD1_9GLOM|nr:9981_t:CDS:2 [Funneliformis geosporum]
MSAIALESAIGVKMIIDKKEWRLTKPVSNRPGYDMEYYRVYLRNYFSSMNIKKFLDNEKLYDSLSIMRKEESLMQWDYELKLTFNLYCRKKNIAYTIPSACLQDMYDVGRCITESTSYKKTMWERIEMELEEINVENLGFDHPICSGILDIKSEPFTNIPGSVSDIFKESFRRYKLE